MRSLYHFFALALCVSLAWLFEFLRLQKHAQKYGKKTVYYVQKIAEEAVK